MHPGIEKLKRTMKVYFDFAGLSKLIEEVTQNCVECARNKVSGRSYGELKGFIAAEIPWQKVGIDIYGPLNHEENNYKFYVLSMIDVFSRYVEFAIVSDISSVTITKTFYNEWILRYPLPEIVISDRGTQFLIISLKNY
ncbi:YRD6 [Hepatospora eriocheir]|uniref:YRD6 n=1 Tax=Hepatospora eriocheir TaxID=1081669 RepID=A0A1X0Q9J0_9MICR|nr:YRD6 [Hepatospora eriocheir]